jgi:SNF2 family DNA or RNA helicase
MVFQTELQTMGREIIRVKFPRPREPFDRQKNAARLIYKMKRVLLAWEMGTGKTQASLHFVGAMLWAKKINRALIICKLRGIAVWENEIELCLPKNVTYAVMRPGPMPLNWQNSGIILVNYDYARTRIKELRKLHPDVVIIDESHRIKNPNARQSRMAHKLGKICRYAICLSGTPIGNHPLDVWSQFKFLNPWLLEEKFKDFKEHYAIWGGFGGHELRKYRNLKELGRLLRPYTSIQKKNINVEKTFIEVPIDIPANAKRVYKEMDKDLVTYVTSEDVVSAPIVLAKLMKLSQISGGFLQDSETKEIFPLHTAKLEALKELTDSLQEQGEKRVVVFARFLWELEQIKKILAPDWATYTIKGGVTIAGQKLAEMLFKNDGGAMLCQIASGSESINLQSAKYVFFYSCDYSSINFQQAQDRVHRHGQKANTCYYYVLLAKGTRDRAIYNILRGKKEMADSMIKMIREEKSA